MCYVHEHTCIKSYFEGQEAGEEVATATYEEEMENNFFTFPCLMFQSYEIHFSSAYLPSHSP